MIINNYELGREGAPNTDPQTSLGVTIIPMLSMISPTLAEQSPNVACVKRKINMSPPNGSFQLCFESLCQIFNEDTKSLTCTLPISSHQVEIGLTMLRNHSIEKLGTARNQPGFCDHL
ncbi:hypothetical protein RB195_013817 [Necator americanus]|uniref:Uncharacterized protein n=1 Tax=Necator americanus TaxID=51031 RepID=A0ABR1DXD2_NECAM